MFVRQRVTCDGFVCVYYSCCLCACIPCCIDALRDVRHSCPNCNSFIGRFERLKWRCWKPVLEQATGCCCLLRSYVSYVVSFHAAIQTSSLSLSLSLSLSVHGHLSQSFPGSRTPYFLDGIVTRYPARFITIIVAVWQLGRLICPRLYRHFGVALTGLRMAGIQSTSYVFRRS